MLKGLPIELMFWITALVMLAFSNSDLSHFRVCPLYNFGITWCPGCGLGRSITCILHGNLQASFHQHWFGIPALIILLHRIVQLLNKYCISFKYKSKI